MREPSGDLDGYSYYEEGSVYYWVCQTCGAMVANLELHTQWHNYLNKVANDASWGGMMRPKG